MSNRSYADAFTKLTGLTDLERTGNEARFQAAGHLVADLTDGGGDPMKMRPVLDCARFAGRQEARAAFKAADGALEKAITL